MIALNTLAQTLLPRSIYQRLAASDVSRRLARGSFWSLVNALVMKTATLVQAVVLARLLGIGGFGEWGILLSTIAMVGVFASFGLGVTTTKHVAQWHNTEPERLGRLLGLLQIVAFTMGLLICLVLVLASDPMADHLLNAPQLSGALVIVGITVLLNAVTSVYVGIINGLERFRDSAAIHAFTTLTGVCLTIFLAYFYGVFGAVLGLAATSALNAGAFSAWAFILLGRKNIPLYARKPLSEWHGIRDFALPTAIAWAVVIVAVWIAQVALVQQPEGYAEMGAYQASSQWRTLIAFLPTQLLAAYLPVLSSLQTKASGNMVQLHNRMMMFVLLVTMVLSAPIILSSPWLMSLYGTEFIDYWLILALVSLIAVFDIAHVVYQNAAIARGYAWTLILSNLPFLLAVAFGVVWLIPAFAGVGLSATLLLAYSSRVFAEHFIFRYKNKISAKA